MKVYPEDNAVYYRSATSTAELETWSLVNRECQTTLDRHQQHWWQGSGYTLAVLLRNAGYSPCAQYKILKFFAQTVTPNLGASTEAKDAGGKRWKSFMTDDNNPIELSWDWHTGSAGSQEPMIRFSMEPVGVDAGTSKDPNNNIAAGRLRRAVLAAMPDTNMTWFDHFDKEFQPPPPSPLDSKGRKKVRFAGNASEDHSSKIFWAFDLENTESENGITNKAYFFPGYKAKRTGQTNLAVIADAVTTVPTPTYKPRSTDHKLAAFHMFESYANEYHQRFNTPLEMDMVAIDMTPDPLKSRLKIYYRDRRTSFASVRESMTFGGRVPATPGSEMQIGLSNLRRLWDNLFDQEGVSEDVELDKTNHRTAGILYNLEFRLGDAAPKAKIYLPVRHYARDDRQIMNAVSDYMCGSSGPNSSFVSGKNLGFGSLNSMLTRPESNLNTPPPTPLYCPRVSLKRNPSSYGFGNKSGKGYGNGYVDAMTSVFSQESLRSDRGLQTYVGASIQPAGELRVVSYINPQDNKFRDQTQPQPPNRSVDLSLDLNQKLLEQKLKQKVKFDFDSCRLTHSKSQMNGTGARQALPSPYPPAMPVPSPYPHARTALSADPRAMASPSPASTATGTPFFTPRANPQQQQQQQHCYFTMPVEQTTSYSMAHGGGLLVASPA